MHDNCLQYMTEHHPEITNFAKEKCGIYTKKALEHGCLMLEHGKPRGGGSLRDLIRYGEGDVWCFIRDTNWKRMPLDHYTRHLLGIKLSWDGSPML